MSVLLESPYTMLKLHEVRERYLLGSLSLYYHHDAVHVYPCRAMSGSYPHTHIFTHCPFTTPYDELARQTRNVAHLAM